MKMLTTEIKKRLPKLYSQENQTDPTVHVKFFAPWTNWTCFATEGQEEDGEFLFFGWVEGQDAEFGYFNLNEMESVRGPWGLKIERDLYFTPKLLSQCSKKFQHLLTVPNGFVVLRQKPDFLPEEVK